MKVYDRIVISSNFPPYLENSLPNGVDLKVITRLVVIVPGNLFLAHVLEVLVTLLVGSLYGVCSMPIGTKIYLLRGTVRLSIILCVEIKKSMKGISHLR